ncbi:MAG: hypothetical protein KGL63_06575 [Betaproteobacteria bacterium]|nr:hypothetical protein [Betaproteobacteria bacterium]
MPSTRIRTRASLLPNGDVALKLPGHTRTFSCPEDGGGVYEILENGARRLTREYLDSEGPFLSVPYKGVLLEVIRHERHRWLARLRYEQSKQATGDLEQLRPANAYYKVELLDGTWAYAQTAICLRRKKRSL